MLQAVRDVDVRFGLMALDLGLVARDDLLDALGAWAADRSRPLADLLVERGFITEERRALVRMLIEADEADRGPVAVESYATLAGDSRAAPGPGRFAPTLPPDLMATRSIPASRSDAVGSSRFRVLRPHNEGGLGLISVALDEELDRQVALKEMKVRYADDVDCRRRFLMEAEVTGKLEHPGIVPVYGLGSSPEGRPYYAMRLIRGDSLAEAIDRLHKGGKSGFDPVRRSLTSHQVLERFLAVCETIEYAHSRGVLHRDLKPENVMLGPFGETLVVDWGLARPMGRAFGTNDSGEAPVRPLIAEMPVEYAGSPTGTPRYMSPEQAAGDHDRLGVATDVYGLGATLYHLLCGEPPLRGVSGSEVYRRVEQGKVPPVRAVNRRVPRSLEAVTSRAMALRPEDRYPSARALADDLRRWLADEPVYAYRERPTARMGRWARRHKATALSIVATMLLVSTLSTIFAAFYRDSARSEKVASDRAEVAQAKAEVALRGAREAQDEVLRGSASFAAATLTREIETIARVLSARSRSPEAAALVKAAAGKAADDPDRLRLQAWLDARFQEYKVTSVGTSWTLTGADGVQVGRAPFSASTFGRSFAYRDYFHGEGRDLPAEEAAERMARGGLAPVAHFHGSPVFRSASTGNPMVAFSGPIADPEGGAIVAVLSISVEVGDFEMLRTGGGRDLVVSLVDTRPDDAGRAGLVLQHPWLGTFQGNQPRVYHDEARVGMLARLDAEAVRSAALVAPIDRDYRDPIGRAAGGRAFGGRWAAAFEPVVVREGHDGPLKTGWVVVVQGMRDEGAVPRPPGD